MRLDAGADDDADLAEAGARGVEELRCSSSPSR
jgi:hypothetical protein